MYYFLFCTLPFQRGASSEFLGVLRRSPPTVTVMFLAFYTDIESNRIESAQESPAGVMARPMHDAVSRAHCILVPAPPQPSLLAEDDDGPIDTDELYLAETEARTIKELHRMQSQTIAHLEEENEAKDAELVRLRKHFGLSPASAGETRPSMLRE